MADEQQQEGEEDLDLTGMSWDQLFQEEVEEEAKKGVEPEVKEPEREAKEPVREEPEREEKAEAEEEERPEPKTLEQLEAENRKLQEELHGKHKAMLRERERARMARAQLQRATAEEELSFTRDDYEEAEDGTIKLKPAAQERMRSRYQLPAHEEDHEALAERFRQDVTEGLGEESSAAFDEVVSALKWVDERLVQEARRDGRRPTEMGGFDGVMEYLEDTGVASQFRERFKGLDLEDVVMASSSKRKLRRLVEHRMEDDTEETSPSGSQRPAREVVTPPSRSRPRPMAARGRGREPSRQSDDLMGVDLDQLFDMPEEEYRERERRSAAKLLK